MALPLPFASHQVLAPPSCTLGVLPKQTATQKEFDRSSPWEHTAVNPPEHSSSDSHCTRAHLWQCRLLPDIIRLSLFQRHARFPAHEICRMPLDVITTLRLSHCEYSFFPRAFSRWHVYSTRFKGQQRLPLCSGQQAHEWVATEQALTA